METKGILEAKGILESSKLATMVLQLLPQVGVATYWRLIETFTTPETAIEQSSDTLRSHLSDAAVEQLIDYRRQPLQSALGEKLRRQLDWLGSNDVAVITLGDHDYPRLLAEIHHPPPLLYLRGNSDCLHLPQLAVVGSRKPTRQGSEIAYEFSRYLTRSGFTITSGLALGVDGIAHKGALDGGGKTIAVLGTGIDVLYPKRHRQLAMEILRRDGALISEFPLGVPALPENFPQRNRIISGLSLGVLVVEATLKSGSLISARFAMQQNREVFAIPGSIYNPLCRGCHRLIREGATLVERAQDILEQLEGMLGYKYQELPIGPGNGSGSSESGPPMDFTARPGDKEGESKLTEQESSVLSCLDFEPTTVDSLVLRCGIDVAAIMSSLVNLELMGLVRHTDTGYQRLR